MKVQQSQGRLGSAVSCNLSYWAWCRRHSQAYSPLARPADAPILPVAAFWLWPATLRITWPPLKRDFRHLIVLVFWLWIGLSQQVPTPRRTHLVRAVASIAALAVAVVAAVALAVAPIDAAHTAFCSRQVQQRAFEPIFAQARRTFGAVPLAQRLSVFGVLADFQAPQLIPFA